MKRIFFLFICVFFFICAKAQGDWSGLYLDRTVYFENAGKSVYTLRVDSVAKDGKILYLLPDIHPMDGMVDIYTLNAGSWLSRSTTLEANGDIFFTNGQNSSMLIKPQACLNETWEAFDNGNIKIKAQVIAAGPKQVLGETDSVKTVSFFVSDKDGDVVEHSLNNWTVEISKRFGFVKLINFYSLENSEDIHGVQLGEFNLIGIHELGMGFSPIRSAERYYDFQPGDEFHIYYLDHPFGPSYTEKKEIKRYLTRTDYADSIVYSYEQKINQVERSADMTIKQIFIKDTVKQKIVKGEVLFTSEPNEPYENGTLKLRCINTTPLPTMFVEDQHLIWDQECSCLTPIISDVCENPSRYSPGLGDYHQGCCEIFNNKYCHDLVYYKKGDMEVGTPLEFPNQVESVQSNGIQIAVTDKIITVTLEEVRKVCLSLYDMNGHLRHRQTANSSIVHIPASAFPTGIYLLKADDMENNINYTEKIVLQ